jgi:hypothetical protein
VNTEEKTSMVCEYYGDADDKDDNDGGVVVVTLMVMMTITNTHIAFNT